MPRDPLLADRERTHGDFRSTAIAAQQIKSHLKIINWSKLPPQQREALEMIAAKIARILAGDPFCEDHWNDIAGYAKLGAEACND